MRKARGPGARQGCSHSPRCQASNVPGSTPHPSHRIMPVISASDWPKHRSMQQRHTRGHSSIYFDAACVGRRAAARLTSNGTSSNLGRCFLLRGGRCLRFTALCTRRQGCQWPSVFVQHEGVGREGAAQAGIARLQDDMRQRWQPATGSQCTSRRGVEHVAAAESLSTRI